MNLAILCYYKYSTFFLDNINQLFQSHIHVPEVVMPIGISFFVANHYYISVMNIFAIISSSTSSAVYLTELLPVSSALGYQDAALAL